MGWWLLFVMLKQHMSAPFQAPCAGLIECYLNVRWEFCGKAHKMMDFQVPYFQQNVLKQYNVYFY